MTPHDLVRRSRSTFCGGVLRSVTETRIMGSRLPGNDMIIGI